MSPSCEDALIIRLSKSIGFWVGYPVRSFALAIGMSVQQAPMSLPLFSSAYKRLSLPGSPPSEDLFDSFRYLRPFESRYGKSRLRSWDGERMVLWFDFYVRVLRRT